MQVKLIVTKDFQNLKLSIKSVYGKFSKDYLNWKRSLDFTGTTAEINLDLAEVIYKNEMFDSIEYTDYCKVWIEGYPEITFPIKIKRDMVPIMLPSKADFKELSGEVPLHEKITVVIKTFMRYDCLTVLVKSIRAHYPKMRIIIADDSPKELSYEIDDDHVTYYRMPEYTGQSLK